MKQYRACKQTIKQQSNHIQSQFGRARGMMFTNHKSKTKNQATSDNIVALNIMSNRHFIFGYGSLICPKSRAITAPTLTNRLAQPISVQNLKRSWSARVDNDPHVPPQQTEKDEIRQNIRGHTAVGVIRDESGCWCSGVLIEVSDMELAQFDEREYGYNRVQINLIDIWSLHPNDDSHVARFEEAQHIVLREADRIRKSQTHSSETISQHQPLSVWVYVQQVSIPANKHFPIFQSYVDVILRGCLSISPCFARRFLDTTELWYHEHDTHGQDHYTWIEDRHDPYYIRADTLWSSTMASVMDNFLLEHHPQAFHKRIALPAAQRILNAFEKSSGDFE